MCKDKGLAPVSLLLLAALAVSLAGAVGLKLTETQPAKEEALPPAVGELNAVSPASQQAGLLHSPTLWEDKSTEPIGEINPHPELVWEERRGWEEEEVATSTPPSAAPEVENPKEATSTPESTPTVSSGTSVAAPVPPLIKVLISEVQIAGANANDEFVELYNPTGEAVNLSGWKLTKKTSSGNEYNLVSSPAFTGAIAAQGYFLIAHPEWNSSSSADFIYSNRSSPLANNNTLLLYDSALRVIDKLGWGTSLADFEGMPFEQNPGDSQSLERKANQNSSAQTMTSGEDRYGANGYDSDNNSHDFVLRSAPEAQNVSGFKEPRFAPSRIVDLVASASGASALLAWTTPADNDSLRSSLRYDIRWSTSPLSEDNWINSPAFDSGLMVGESGTRASTTISGLAEGETYYFAIKTKDDTEAISLFSNVASVSIAALPPAGGFASPSPQATATRSLVINEIAWMGTASSTNDEWIEILNTTANAIDFTGWALRINGATSTLTLRATTIPAGGLWLLERTNDDPISDITADAFFTGALANTGAKLEIIDPTGTIIDTVDASGGWFAGINEGASRRVSMERVSPNGDGSAATNWASNDELTMNGLDAGGNPIRGTPRAKNSRTP